MTSYLRSLLIILLACGCAFAQNPEPPPAPASPPLQPGQTEPPAPDKRIFGVLPNYRTANATAVYMPITVKQKLTIASKDSFDYPLLGLAAVLAGEQQWANT